MLKKAVSVVLLLLLATSMLTLAFRIQPTRAQPRTIVVPDDFSLIQEAVNSANPGDTILVRAGTYYEDIVVGKSLAIISESGPEDTIVCGSGGAGKSVFGVFETNNLKLSGFTLTNDSQGILFHDVTNSTIMNLNVRLMQESGIMLDVSNNNVIANSSVSSGSRLSEIEISSSYSNLITQNNVSSGNGIYCLYSFNNTISKNNLLNNSIGIFTYASLGNSIFGNNIKNNTYGIQIGYLPNGGSSSNSISGNNIEDNTYGIEIALSSYNCIFHNNFLNNTNQTVKSASVNIWDDANARSGGNYWSDYNGTDTNNDGIGDTPYVIDLHNRDNYPLMTPWTASNTKITNVVTSRTVMENLTTSSPVSINVMMLNYGNDTEAFNVTAYANQTMIGEIYDVSLTSENSTIISFTWNTTGLDYGNYTISAYAEIDTANNNFTGSVVMARVTVPGDINGDFKANLYDLVILANAYGSKPGDTKWNPNADLARPWNSIGLSDLVTLALNYYQQLP